jgi:hypothetical protein
MKKLSLTVLVVLLGALATPAEATSFNLQSYTTAVRSSGLGLNVWTQNLFNTGTEITLENAGEEETHALFTLGTYEGSVDWDDWIPYAIGVGFNFSKPEAFGGTAIGLTGAINIGYQLGYVLWDNPLRLAFGTNGLLDIILSSSHFSVPGKTTVYATFKLVRPDSNGPVSVPEPGVLLLMAIGVAVALRVAPRRARV